MPMVTKPCLACGKEFDSWPNHGRKYCSRECGHAHGNAGRKVGDWKGGRILVSCAGCGKTVETWPSLISKNKGKYCGQECFNLNRQKRRTYNCAFCGAERTVKAGMPNRYCSQQCHYMDGKLTEQELVERRRLATRQRRARMAAVESEPYTLLEIAERDGWRCQLCGRKVRQRIPQKGRPNRMSPSVDHIVPISHGGHDLKANVQLAHLGCNAKKRNRLLPQGEQLRLLG